MTTLPKDALTFMGELAENNHREWFETQKPRFKTNETAVKAFAQALQEKMNDHDRVDGFKLFRVYRDVRFSKDKTPYKTHFGISFHREKPAFRGGYYLHIKPGDTFIAGGFWNPNKDDLQRIRKELEVDADEFRDIINDAAFQQIWGSLEGEEVKTAPKGFSKEDPNIDLIKKKAYLFTKRYEDRTVVSSGFLAQLDADFAAIRPFFDYMSSVLTTDLNGVSRL